MKIRWYVKSGPDNSHLQDCRWFDRLKDAQAHVRDLPPTPDGTKRPYSINRVEYQSVSRLWERIVSSEVVEEYMRPLG